MIVSIEVPKENLEAYGLTLEEVARAIRTASLERPGGQIETDGGELLVRVAAIVLAEAAPRLPLAAQLYVYGAYTPLSTTRQDLAVGALLRIFSRDFGLC